jgi:hypothetical protein
LCGCFLIVSRDAGVSNQHGATVSPIHTRPGKGPVIAEILI